MNRSLNTNELPEKIFVENICFDVTVFKQVDREKFSYSDDSFIDFDMLYCDNVNGIILFVNDLCVAILKSKYNSFFMFDPHSHDADGKLFDNGSGKSILIEFSNINATSEYIFTTYNFISYQLAYIEIKSPENTSSLEKSLEKFKITKLYRQHLDKDKSKKAEDGVKKVENVTMINSLMMLNKAIKNGGPTKTQRDSNL